jgi:hypothetical protein
VYGASVARGFCNDFAWCRIWGIGAHMQRTVQGGDLLSPALQPKSVRKVRANPTNRHAASPPLEKPAHSGHCTPQARSAPTNASYNLAVTDCTNASAFAANLREKA